MHYSKNILASFLVFTTDYKDELVGAMIYGKMQWLELGTYVDTEEDLLELRRLCCIDKTPKILRVTRWSLDG